MKKRAFKIPFLGKSAIQILRLELPVILLCATALLICCLHDYRIDPVGTAFYYTELLQYIVASILISIGTALTADLVEREKNGNGQ